MDDQNSYRLQGSPGEIAIEDLVELVRSGVYSLFNGTQFNPMPVMCYPEYLNHQHHSTRSANGWPIIYNLPRNSVVERWLVPGTQFEYRSFEPRTAILLLCLDMEILDEPLSHFADTFSQAVLDVQLPQSVSSFWAI